MYIFIYTWIHKQKFMNVIIFLLLLQVTNSGYASDKVVLGSQRMLFLTWYVLQYGRWLILDILRITYLGSELWWIVGIPIQSFISRSPSLSRTTHHNSLQHHGENTYVGIQVLSCKSRSLSRARARVRVRARALTLQHSSRKKLRAWGSQTVSRIHFSPSLSLHARVHTIQHALYKKPHILGYKYCFYIQVSLVLWHACALWLTVENIYQV